MLNKDTPDILQTIVSVKIEEVNRLKQEMPVDALQMKMESLEKPVGFSSSLKCEKTSIIAEIKKASPSKGILRDDFNPLELARIYSENGASAISVITNVDHFQGKLDYLHVVKKALSKSNIPILRKEFIFDPYQVYESRAYGADAILLIVAMLSTKQLCELDHLAKDLGMETLVEVHDYKELQIALNMDANIIGINNRDLRTFVTDRTVTANLAKHIPNDKIIVSESGISEKSHIEEVSSAGAHAALIGEALVTASDPGNKLRELI